MRLASGGSPSSWPWSYGATSGRRLPERCEAINYGDDGGRPERNACRRRAVNPAGRQAIREQTGSRSTAGAAETAPLEDRRGGYLLEALIKVQANECQRERIEPLMQK